MIYKSLTEWSADTALPKAVARSSSDWQPNPAVVISSAAMVGGTGFTAIAARKVGRKTLIISNIGVNAATISNIQNPPNSLGVLLGVGAVWVLDTEGEVYIRSQLGTTVDVVELYNPISSPSATLPFYGRPG